MEILIPIFGIMIVLVPVIGATLVMTLRLGGKPFVETLARELRLGSSDDQLARRVAELTDQVETLSTEVRALSAARSFDEKLLAAREEDG